MNDSTLEGASRWGHFMEDLRENAAVHTPLEVRGTLTRLAGLVLEAVGLKVPVGSQCLIGNGLKEPVLAEVVGFSGDRAYLMPAGDTHGLSSGASVTPLAPYRPVPRMGQANKPPSPDDRGALRLPLGRGLLGRVVDSHGHPLDHLGPIINVDMAPMDRAPINAMDRDPVREPLDTGVRAINALLTVGRG
ncbi:MAG: flagellum-specific ATP synthase FliI, partial [Comamonadaceae bacterium]|nr:flagellum-specific ATP synthase FliI [Comamonadaceae bacterium]